MFTNATCKHEINTNIEKEREDFEKEQIKKLQIKIAELKKKIKNIDKNINDYKCALKQLLDEFNNDVKIEYCNKIMNWEKKKDELEKQLDKLELLTREINKPNNGFNSI